MTLRHSRLALSTLLITALITGCGRPSAPAGPEPAPSGSEGDAPIAPIASAPSQPAHGAEAPGPLAGARSESAAGTDGLTHRTCLLVVDGVTHVSGRCLVYPMGDGGFTLNVWSRGKPARSHFAVVSTNGAGVADASWNTNPDDSHAWDSLGSVRLEAGCWVNDRARICAR